MINNYDSLQIYIQNVLARNGDVNIIAQIPNYIYLAEIKLARLPKNLGYKKVITGLLTEGIAVYAKPNRWRATVSMNYGSGNSMEVITRQSFSGTRTIGFALAHSFEAGDTISVVNVGTDYDGTGLIITDLTSTSITYVQGSSSESPTASTGHVTTSQNSVNWLLPRGYELSRQYWPDDSKTDNPKYYSDYDYNHWLLVPTPSQNGPFEVIYYEQPMPLSDSNQQNWFTEFAPDALYYGSLIEASIYLKNDDRVATWQGMYDQAVSAMNGEAQGRISDAATTRSQGI